MTPPFCMTPPLCFEKSLSGDLGLRDLAPAAGEKILAFWSPEIAISKGETPQNGFEIAKFSRLRRHKTLKLRSIIKDYGSRFGPFCMTPPPLVWSDFYSKGGGSCKAILADTNQYWMDLEVILHVFVPSTSLASPIQDNRIVIWI